MLLAIDISKSDHNWLITMLTSVIVTDCGLDKSLAIIRVGDIAG
jgi:hypothetical protein